MGLEMRRSTVNPEPYALSLALLISAHWYWAGPVLAVTLAIALIVFVVRFMRRIERL